MFSDHANLDKPGIEWLEHLGFNVVVANKALHEKGKVTKFTVVNVKEKWVDSVHGSHYAAWSRAQELTHLH